MKGGFFMKKEITSIDTKQSAKIIAIVSALFSLIFTLVGLVMILLGIVQGSQYLKSIGMIYFLMPLWYIILVYLFSRLVYWVYNKVAARFGGIVIEIEDK